MSLSYFVHINETGKLSSFDVFLHISIKQKILQLCNLFQYISAPHKIDMLNKFRCMYMKKRQFTGYKPSSYRFLLLICWLTKTPWFISVRFTEVLRNNKNTIKRDFSLCKYLTFLFILLKKQGLQTVGPFNLYTV